MSETSPLMSEIPGSFSPIPPQAMNESVNDSLSMKIDEFVPIVEKAFVFALDAAGTNIGQLASFDCGFNAKSAKIDNASAQWFYFVQANQYIAPWQIGAVVNLVAGAQAFQIVPGSPGGKTSVAANAQRLTVTFYSVNQWPCPGFSAQAAP